MSHLGGHTTKQTYVTAYTTDVDPRTLPDFATRGVMSEESWRRDDALGEQQTSTKYAAPPPGGQQAHQHLPRYSSDSPLPHHRGSPPRDYGYRQHPPASHQDEHLCSEPSASTLSVTNSAIGNASSAPSGSAHRLRKKYTTTTVTTITTTTILLPRMQEAYVFPSVTAQNTDQQQNVGGAGRPYAITGGGTSSSVPPPQGRFYEVGNGSDGNGQIQAANIPHDSRLVPSKVQLGPNGEGSQRWEFRQHTSNQVATVENRGQLPTLQDLGITSYFAKDGVGNRGAPRQQWEAPYSSAPHRPSNDAALQRQPPPWVAAETRYEVEGGKRYY
ncbi:unspecified product [Leishmania tarentolae]|uniref:Unspecified product n=1 Tax=Leishmania tarentolae TaxID=5689 RepID=A0A640KI81_LEITA|nr:unspecified product [Leishmania tarentolae]